MGKSKNLYIILQKVTARLKNKREQAHRNVGLEPTSTYHLTQPPTLKLEYIYT